MAQKRYVLGMPLATFILLGLFCLLVRLPLLGYLPFVNDEAVYSVMVSEQGSSPTLVPTLFGYPVSWKMAPFFWLYSFLTPLLGWAGLEASYRLPSLAFGFLCIFPLYRIVRHLSDDARASLACLFFLSSFVSIYPGASLLLDSPAMLLILLSIYCYVVKDEPINGGLLAAAAFAFKLVIAFIPPLLAAFALMLAGRRRELLGRSFLLSMALPLSMALINYALLAPFGGGDQLYFEEIFPRVLAPDASASLAEWAISSLNTLAYSMGPIFALSLFGLARYWRSHPLLTVWYALITIPFMAGALYPWYYLPVLPAVCAFAAMALYNPSKGWKGNLGGLAVAALAVLASLYLVSGAYQILNAQHSPEKEAGLAIAGKENVLIIGQFKPGIFAYKEALERGATGRVLDYGLVVGPQGFGGEEAADFVLDYHTPQHAVRDGSFSALYTSSAIFRKDTDISRFDYIVLSGDPGFLLRAPLVYGEGGILVYRVSGD